MIRKAVSKFFSDLKPMTWRQRVDHIWTYYKGGILTVAFILFAAISLIVSNLSQKESAMCGVSVNVTVSTEGTAYLEESYLAHLGTPAGKEAVLYPIYYGSLEEAVVEYEYNYNQIMRPVLMVSAQELDYLLLNAESMQRYMAYELFLDLRSIFSAEELAAMGDSVIRSIPMDEEDQPVETEPIPVAIDISSLPFVSENILSSGPVYLAFANNAPNMDTLRNFWTFLNDWSAS